MVFSYHSGTLFRSLWEDYCNVICTCVLFYQLVFSQVMLVVKNQLANVEDARNLGSVPGLGRSPGEGNGPPLR